MYAFLIPAGIFSVGSLEGFNNTFLFLFPDLPVSHVCLAS